MLFQLWVYAFLLQENIYELQEFNTFKPRGNDNIFHIIGQRLPGYRFELGIQSLSI